MKLVLLVSGLLAAELADDGVEVGDVQQFEESWDSEQSDQPDSPDVVDVHDEGEGESGYSV